MLTAGRIRELLDRLNARLAREGVAGELYLVGGAVMALAFDARASTHDVDGVFVPVDLVRRLARKVAEEAGADEGWLNDAVKGFLSPRGEFSPWLDLGHLRVFVPLPEFHDEDDMRFLLARLGIMRAADALAIVERYYPPERVPAKTRYALEEILGG